MAKNRKAPKPDADGFLRSGIYQRRVGKPPKLTGDEMEAAFDRMADDDAKTAGERLAEIRAWLSPIAMAGLEGPLERESLVWAEGERYRTIDLGEGPQVFRELSLESGSTESEQARNAIEALREIRIIEHNSGTANIDRVIWSSIELGRLVERITVRPYEPLVVSGKRSLDRSAKGGKASKRLTAEQERLAKEIIAKKQVGGISKSAACNRAAADLLRIHAVEVSAKTLSRL